MKLLAIVQTYCFRYSPSLIIYLVLYASRDLCCNVHLILALSQLTNYRESGVKLEFCVTVNSLRMSFNHAIRTVCRATDIGFSTERVLTQFQSDTICIVEREIKI